MILLNCYTILKLWNAIFYRIWILKKYYFVGDAIRNKDSLTMIARPCIADLSILSQFLSQQYKSFEKL